MAEAGFEPCLSDSKPTLVPLVLQIGKQKRESFSCILMAPIGSSHTTHPGQSVTRVQELEFLKIQGEERQGWSRCQLWALDAQARAALTYLEVWVSLPFSSSHCANLQSWIIKTPFWGTTRIFLHWDSERRGGSSCHTILKCQEFKACVGWVISYQHPVRADRMPPLNY